MMRNSLISFLISVSFALLVSACGARQIPAPDDPIGSYEELLARMEERSSGIQGARARAVMEYFGSEGRVRVRQALVVQKPHSLRLETLSPFDTTLSVVVSNFRALTLYDLNEDKAWTGLPTADNLAKLIPLRFTPPDIVSVLLGNAPMNRMREERGIWKVGWDSRRGAWKMYVPGQDGTQLEIFVRHGTWVMAGARELSRRGDVIWEVRTADFLEVRAGDFVTEIPTRVRFLMNQDRLDVSLTVSDYELNPELESWIFELDLDGVEIFSLD